MIAICAALAWEARPVIRALRRVRRVQVGSIRTWQGTSELGPVVVFRAGMGPERAAAAATTVLSHSPVSALINTGCCGGLTAAMNRGRLVVPDRLFEVGAPATELVTDRGWTERLRRVGGDDVDRGPQLTSPQILRFAAEKWAARALYGASAVDMEGAALLRVAAAREVPFASVRAVLDGADADLPDLGGLTDPAGGVRPLKAALAVVRNPLKIVEFFEIQRAAAEVEKGLGKFFEKLLRVRG